MNSLLLLIEMMKRDIITVCTTAKMKKEQRKNDFMMRAKKKNYELKANRETTSTTMRGVAYRDNLDIWVRRLRDRC